MTHCPATERSLARGWIILTMPEYDDQHPQRPEQKEPSQNPFCEAWPTANLKYTFTMLPARPAERGDCTGVLWNPVNGNAEPKETYLQLFSWSECRFVPRRYVRMI